MNPGESNRSSQASANSALPRRAAARGLDSVDKRAADAYQLPPILLRGRAVR